MRYGKLAISIAACAALLAPAPPADAAELGGVEMAATEKVGDHTLVLNGLGLRKKAIFKVYVGGLYLKAKSSDPAAILAADEPRKLIMEFVRDVDAESIIGGWNDCLENNAPEASLGVRDQFVELNEMMTDVEDGDRLTFTYRPGAGVDIGVAGAAKGTIAGKDFADTLFSCWLGPAPPSGDFKDGLLGG